MFPRANVAAGEPMVKTVGFISGVSVGGFAFVVIVTVFLCFYIMRQRERYIKMPMAPPEQAMII